MALTTPKKINIFFVISACIAIFDLAIFFYLPFLTDVRRLLQVSESVIQFTFAVNFIGIGTAAIIYGTLSDIIGRRKIILFGILIFAVSSCCIYYTYTLSALILFRFLQGIGAGVSWAVGNAVMHDIFKGKAFERSIILLHVIIGVTFIISPAIGAYIGDMIGWREVFLIMSASSSCAFIYAYFFLPETSPKNNKEMKDLLRNYMQLLTNPFFRQYLAVKAIMVAVALATMSNISIILRECYHVDVISCGNLMALGSLVFVAGGLACNQLVNFFASNKVIIAGIICIICSSIIVLIWPNISFFSPLTATKLIILKVPYYFGLAAIFGNVTHKIVSIMPKISGSASALMITTEMIISSIFIKIVAELYNKTVYPIELFTLLAAVISLIVMLRIKTHAEY
jgi:DHA1 family bicyclomycin/chloramphenicol resistance-like MFS transporter